MSNYTPYYEGGWKNEEEMTTTPICAEALNHMEEGISAAYDTDIGLYPTETASGDVAVIHDGAEGLPVRDLSVAIEPAQSLNGYDKPWAGGAGKNLLAPTAPAGTVNGITYTVNDDGTVKANGTATAQAVRNFFNNVTPASVGLTDGEYIISGCPSGGSNEKYALRAVTTKASGNTTVSDYGSGATFTIDSSVTAIRVYLYVGNGQTVNNIVFYPMIRKSSETDATFEPYSNICPITGWDAVKVARTSQNLLPKGYSTASRTTNNGITYTVNDDGSVTANGTATAGSYFNYSGWEVYNYPFMRRPGLRLRISGSYPGVIQRLQYNPFGSSTNITLATDTGTGVDFTVPDDVRRYAFFINVTAGQTLDNAKFYPVISLADEGQPTWNPSEAEVEDITLPTTIYGGTLDVTTGILTVDRAMVDLGTLTYTRETSGSVSLFRVTMPSRQIGDGVTGISSQYGFFGTGTLSRMYTMDNGQFGFQSTNTFIAIRDDRYTDANSFKSAVTGQTLVYPLATPQTYTLSPVQVKTLLGENRIYADAGQVTVQYRGEIKQIGVDPTLSVEGMAADAKAVGDALAQIEPGGGGGGGSVTVDTALSSTSTNPVQNKAIYAAIQAVKAVATTSTNGLMSSTDKGHLDTLYADYSSALTALG